MSQPQRYSSKREKPLEEGEFTILVRTLYGLEEILANEILKLGGKRIKVLNRAVSCAGDLGFIYKLNYRCRLALDVQVFEKSFYTHTEKDYYFGVKKMAWEDIIPRGKSIKCKVVSSHPILHHTLFLAQRAKDAICDRLQSLDLPRPDVDVYEPDIEIFLHLDQKSTAVYLNTSGAPLFKRGYRRETGMAPLNEVMAAGLLDFASWNDDSHLIDLFCGSGTILCEAAIKAANIPAQMWRKSFCFMHMANFDEDLWNTIKGAAIDKIKQPKMKIYGMDNNPLMLEVCRENLRKIEMEDEIEVLIKDSLTAKRTIEAPLTIISNVPFDKRITLAEGTYEHLGNALKRRWSPCSAFFLAPRHTLTKQIGLRPYMKKGLRQGKIDCDFAGYTVTPAQPKELKDD